MPAAKLSGRFKAERRLLTFPKISVWKQGIAKEEFEFILPLVFFLAKMIDNIFWRATTEDTDAVTQWPRIIADVRFWMGVFVFLMLLTEESAILQLWVAGELSCVLFWAWRSL